jgi:uncharacterized membrane protein
MSKGNKIDEALSEMWRKDPSNWIWGIFYFNKKDKRIFPPKRSRMMGLTINFANPYSVIMFVAIIVAVVLLNELIKKFK